MKNPYIKIAGRKIGLDYPPIVITEIGINHEGSLIIAKEMVDTTHRAGLLYNTKSSLIVENKISSENAYPLVMEHPFAMIDIDTQEDLDYAEFLFNLHDNSPLETCVEPSRNRG